jgi:16S rRNA (uracil1498-N3)-methyltransferase
MILFYTNNIKDNLATLEEDEATHCTKTLRKKLGDEIHFVDGKGGMYSGKIFGFNKKTCSIRIEESSFLEKRAGFKLHLAIAPTKNMDRLEWFLEKATEIGVDEITLILCQRSERKQIRMDRLNNILIAAMKQSLKNHLPVLNDLTKFKDFIQQDFQGQKFIAHCNEGAKMNLKHAYQQKSDVLIMIGAEGDFSEEEVLLAIKEGCRPISLGEERLRTETAGIVAVHTINLLNQ